MAVEFNTQMRPIGSSLYSFEVARMGSTKTAEGAKDTMSSAADPSAKPADTTADGSKKWHHKLVDGIKSAWASFVNCLKSILCYCYKPAASEQNQSEMETFAAVVNGKDAKVEDVKEAFGKLSKTEKADVINAVMAQSSVGTADIDEEEAEEVMTKEDSFDAKLISKALDRLAIHKDLKAFNDVFKKEDAKSEDILAAFHAMGKIAQQEVAHEVAYAIGNKTGVDVVEYMSKNADNDNVVDGVKAARDKYKIG